MVGWSFVTAVPDGYPLSIGGLNPWEHEWRRIPDAVAHVLDPAYGQPYAMPVYAIGAHDQPIRFAASEFSNSVWGFFVPA